MERAGSKRKRHDSMDDSSAGGKKSLTAMEKKAAGTVHRGSKKAERAEEDRKRAEMLLTESSGYLEPETELEKTYKLKQSEIRKAVDVSTARRAIDLTLHEEHGPYITRWTRGGRHLLLCGRRGGHLCAFDAQTRRPLLEQVEREPTWDACWLHNETFFAVAGDKYCRILDGSGMEIHVLRGHRRPRSLEFLPNHFLLASGGDDGFLRFLDTSTGTPVVAHRTKMGCLSVLRVNPWNAVTTLGHGNGTVTMWTPNMSTPVVKMLVHRGPVTAAAFDVEGKYLVTAGMDSKVKIWDARGGKGDDSFGLVQEYFSPSPATSLDISQRGLLSVACGGRVMVWKDALATKATSPYMVEPLTGKDRPFDVRFRPFEDILAVGTNQGLRSLIVPGAGEPNYDSNVADPYTSLKQRREVEVRSLLDKIPADLISLDPTSIAAIDRIPIEVRREEEAKELAENPDKKPRKTKRKTKGRSKTSRVQAKKQDNVWTEKKEQRKLEQLRLEKERKATEEKSTKPRSALDRFFD